MKKYFILCTFVLSITSLWAQDKKQEDSIVSDRIMFEAPQQEYPKQYIARPLTLKKSILEVQFMPGAQVDFQFGTTVVGSFDSNVKYGITDNIEASFGGNLYTAFSNSIITSSTEDGYIGRWFNSVKGGIAYQFYNDGTVRLSSGGSYRHSKTSGIGMGEATLTGKYTMDSVAGQLNISFSRMFTNSTITNPTTDFFDLHPQLTFQLSPNFSAGFGVAYIRMLGESNMGSSAFTSHAMWSLANNIDLRATGQYIPEDKQSGVSLNTQVGLELNWRI